MTQFTDEYMRDSSPPKIATKFSDARPIFPNPPDLPDRDCVKAA